MFVCMYVCMYVYSKALFTLLPFTSLYYIHHIRVVNLTLLDR